MEASPENPGGKLVGAATARLTISFAESAQVSGNEIPCGQRGQPAQVTIGQKKKAAQTPLSGLHLTTLYTRTTGARNGGLPGSFNPIPLRVPRIHPAVTIAAETHFFSGKFLRKSGGRNESRAKNRLDALEKLPLRPQPDATRVTRGEPRCNCQRIGPTGDVQQPVQDDVFGRKRGVGNHGRSGGLPVNPESASASITARPGSGNGTPVKFV